MTDILTDDALGTDGGGDVLELAVRSELDPKCAYAGPNAGTAEVIVDSPKDGRLGSRSEVHGEQ
jgi:hypothetical protein